MREAAAQLRAASRELHAAAPFPAAALVASAPPPEEAPYGLDAEMHAQVCTYWRVSLTGRHERASEVARRLVGAAEAARWPPHSIALASLRWNMAVSLQKARVQDSAWRPTGAINKIAGEEEAALYAASRAAVCARRDAGSLLTLTPSEQRFQVAWDASMHLRDEPCRPQQPAHSLGYAFAMCMAQKLVKSTLQAWALTEAGEPGGLTRDTARAVERDVHELARLLALVRAVRHAAPGSRDPRAHLVLGPWLLSDEGCLIHVMHEWMALGASHAWYPRTMAMTGHHGLVALMHDAWRDAADAFGPLLREGEAKTAGSLADMAAARDALRQSWVPRVCAHCGAAEAEPRLYKLCGRCHGPAYCGKEHQLAHWRAGHRKECAAAAAAAAAASS